MPVPQQTVGAYQYSTPNVDIGSGYAAGITQAGKSISGAITGLLGGIDEKGNVTSGILSQNQTANDMLSVMNQMKNPDGSKILGDDAYQSLMGKSLGAKQQALGMYQGLFQYNLQQSAEANRQIQVAKATAAAQAPYRLQEIQATGAQQIAAATAGREAAGERRITLAPPPNPQGPAPNQAAPQNPSDFNTRFPTPNNSLKKSLNP
jgi:hypothetical protein